jgi:hypothetical protein
VKKTLGKDLLCLVKKKALGKEASLPSIFFADCFLFGTRQTT